MALYVFEILKHGRLREDQSGFDLKKLTTGCANLQGAREFAQEMAESILRRQTGPSEKRFCLITIQDEMGVVLDKIRTRLTSSPSSKHAFQEPG